MAALTAATKTHDAAKATFAELESTQADWISKTKKFETEVVPCVQQEADEAVSSFEDARSKAEKPMAEKNDRMESLKEAVKALEVADGEKAKFERSLGVAEKKFKVPSSVPPTVFPCSLCSLL